MKPPLSTLALALLFASSACVATKEGAPPNELRPDEAAAGWVLLFDGETLDGWRGFKKDGDIEGWEVIDGAIVRTGPGGDIITEDQYGSFELSFQWKVTNGANSGVFFHGTEEGNYVWESAPEYQILDNAEHADGKSPLTSASANYALHQPPADYTRPVGEWNEGRIAVHGNHVEHWLNGTKVVEYELGSPEWEALVAASKFGKMPAYGRSPRGHIALQDHGDEVAFRDLKLLVLD